MNIELQIEEIKKLRLKLIQMEDDVSKIIDELTEISCGQTPLFESFSYDEQDVIYDA